MKRAIAMVGWVVWMMGAMVLGGGCGKGDGPKEASKIGGAGADKPYPLKVCIVSGEKLGSMGEPASMTHEGQQIKFCCQDCIKEFTSDPKKFIVKLQPGH